MERGRPRSDHVSRQPGRQRGTALLAWLLWAVAAAFGVIGLVPAVLALDPGSIGSTIAVVAFASVGLLIVIRVPGNRIGWILLVSPLLLLLEAVVPHVAASAIGGPPGDAWSMWLTQILFLPAVMPLVVFLPLLYPTGHLPSGAWQPVADIALVTLIWGTVAVVAQGPFGVGGSLGDFLATITSNLFVFCLVILVGVASLLVRDRGATEIKGDSLRWLAAPWLVAGLAGGIAFLTFSTSGWLASVSYVAFIVTSVAIALLARAIGFGVRRRALDELDPADPAADRRAGHPMIVSAVWATGAVLVAISLVTAHPGGPDDPLTAVADGAAALAALTIGAILVRRGQRARIGCLLIAGGLFGALNGGLAGLADFGLNVQPGSVPGAIWLAWASQWVYLPFFWLLAGLVPLLYPAGRLASPRWRTVVILGTLLTVTLTVEVALIPWPTGLFPVNNPLAASDLAGNFMGLISSSNFLLYIAVLAAVASLVLRFRRATGVEGEQIKWFAAVGAVTGPAFVVGVVAGGSTNSETTLSSLGFAVADLGLIFLPVAIGIAVLRYRLYDIDLVIRRTLVYGALALLLAVAYAGSVLLLSALLAPLTAENSLAVAGSTLLVAALFSPVRRRVQSTVDRHFYRSRYDATRELADLSQRLRGEVDLEGVKAEVVSTIGRTLQPTSATIWLRAERTRARTP